jgi:hypothetical protein
MLHNSLTPITLFVDFNKNSSFEVTSKHHALTASLYNIIKQQPFHLMGCHPIAHIRPQMR